MWGGLAAGCFNVVEYGTCSDHNEAEQFECFSINVSNGHVQQMAMAATDWREHQQIVIYRYSASSTETVIVGPVVCKTDNSIIEM